MAKKTKQKQTISINDHRHNNHNNNNPDIDTPPSPPPPPPPHPSLLLETFSDNLPVPKVLVFDLDYTLWPFWVDTHVSPPVRVDGDGDGDGDGGGGGDGRKGGKKEGVLVDSCNESFSFYPSVPDLLLSLNALPHPPILAIASRSCAPGLATTMLKKLQLQPSFTPQMSSSSSSDHTPAAAAAVAAAASAPASTTKKNSHPPSKSAYEFFDYVEIFPGDKKRHFANIRKASGVEYDEMVFFDDEARNRNVEALGVVMLLVENGVSAAEVDKGVRDWRRRKGKGKGKGDVKERKKVEEEEEGGDE